MCRKTTTFSLSPFPLHFSARFLPIPTAEHVVSGEAKETAAGERYQVKHLVPVEIGGFPRPVSKDGSQVHLLMADWAGVFLAHYGPPCMRELLNGLSRQQLCLRCR